MFKPRLLLSFLLWLLLLPIDLLSTLVGYLLAPVLPLFASADGWLPVWLSWFQTPDNPLDGDPDFKAAHANTPTYWRRVLWLYRNPVYGFAWTVMAATPALASATRVWGNPPISDVPNFQPGWMFVTQERWWHFYVVLPSFPGKCFRLNLGWKLSTDGNNNPAMFAFYLNPFKAHGPLAA